MRATRQHFAFAGLLIVAFISIVSAMSETRGAGRNLSPEELLRYRGGQQVDTYNDACCYDIGLCVKGTEITCDSYLNETKCNAGSSKEWEKGEIQQCYTSKNDKGKTCKSTKAFHACYISHNCVWDEDGASCIDSIIGLQTNAPDLCSDDCP